MIREVGKGKKFDIKVDLNRNIILYTMRGTWENEDFDCFIVAYKEALNLLNKPWGAIVDAREQFTSMKVNSKKMHEINLYAIENGMICGAIIASSPNLKMTISRTISSIGINAKICSNQVEADLFLKQNGF